jgi:acetyl-CoA synthetase
VLGRLDDVVNVSGHRLSTIEIESALVAHPGVGEAGVTGVVDPVTGQAVAAFVVPAREPAPAADELRAQVAREIGPVAKPRHVVVVPELPKTRSGKILRRLLAQLWEGQELGDTTSLQNPWAVDQVRQAVAAARTPKEDR